MTVKLLLERAQFRVVQADSARAAVDRAIDERPDILMIDLDMPEMDVPVAIHGLRRDFSQAALPLIVLTAERGSQIERRVRDLGADDYIVKPFEPSVLISTVSAVFRRSKARAA